MFIPSVTEAVYKPTALISGLNCDVALPSATQNEINLEGAKKLAAGGCWCVAEGELNCHFQP
jgi:glutamate dehydrogenase (NADP+)